MKYYIYKDRNCLKPLKDTWNECLRSSGLDRIFLREEWFDLLIRYAGGFGKPVVLVGYKNKIPAIILPCAQKSVIIHRLPFQGIVFLSNFYSPYCAPIVNSGEWSSNCEAYAAMLKEVCRENWQVMLFEGIPEEHGEYLAMCEACMTLNLPFVEYDTIENWILECEGMTYADYLKSRSRRRRESLRRKRRKLEKNDRVSWEVITDPGSKLEKGIEEYYKVYSRSWKRPEPYPEFHRELVFEAAERGWLRLGLLRLGNDAIAAQIWLVYSGVASILKLAYDENYADLSAGTVLTLVLLERVLDVDKVREVDFLTGGDAYKKGWMSKLRKRYSLLVYNPKSIAGIGLWKFDKYVYQWLERIKMRRQAIS